MGGFQTAMTNSVHMGLPALLHNNNKTKTSRLTLRTADLSVESVLTI